MCSSIDTARVVSLPSESEITAQSDPDSQTDPHQARNTSSGCNATPSHGRHTGFAGGRAGERYPLPWLPLLDAPRWCI